MRHDNPPLSPKNEWRVHVTEYATRLYQLLRERRRLLDQYGEATRAYSKSGRALSDGAVSYEADMFNRAWEASQRAWRECARLRHELHRHMIEHGC